MPKFMNAELERIRDSLTCGHCAAIFKGSDSQAWKVKYEKKVVYCSTTCRHAAMRNKLSTPIPNRGPCKTCGKEFFSRTAKIYCSLDCYVKSDQFKAHTQDMREKALAPEVRRKMAETRKHGEVVHCLECNKEVYQKRSRKRKFCSTSCYRSYLAKRFDRWVANPEGMALPQCYDEFLDRDVLPCVVEGCDWKGRHLTLHVNQVHGIRQDEFKRAAGFNLSTGVISRPLAQLLQQRPTQGVARAPVSPEVLELARAALRRAPMKYKSAEGREHAKKARVIAGPGPERVCMGCGLVFRQTSPFGRALYCSIECRDSAYAERRRQYSKVRDRDAHGRFLWTNRAPK